MSKAFEETRKAGEKNGEMKHANETVIVTRKDEKKSA